MKVQLSKILLGTLISLFFILSAACSTLKKDSDNRNELITDRSFQHGIEISGNDSAYPLPIDTMFPFGNSPVKPLWRLAQWGSKFLINSGSFSKKSDSIIYYGKSKKISFFKKNINITEIGLEVLGSKEFKTPRKLNEEWPHLLLEQYINSDFKLCELEVLEYSASFKLDYCFNFMGETFNPELHTAQFTQYFTIQNMNKESKGYGDFFWFGIPVYDYRYKYIKLYAEQDLGKDDATKKFIYSVSSSDIFDGNLHENNTINISSNIYPHIQKGFETAKQRGYLPETTFNDLSVTSMNVGWEVPGIFDCKIIFTSPSLKSIKR